jgi:gliding motility-associated protein GldM
MAGGKETPRQKMIGMMYLVLTALLALQVGSAVLEKFAIINTTLEEVIVENNAKSNEILAAIQEAAGKSTNEKVISAKDRAVKIRALTESTLKKVEDLKKHMITESGGTVIDEKLIQNHGSKAASLMINQQAGKDYEKLLNDYVAQLSELSGEKFEKIAKAPKDLELFKENEDHANKDFLTFTFENTPVIAALASVTEHQSQMLDYESRALDKLAAEADKVNIKLDKFILMARPKSSIVAAGSKYEADLFITGSSSAMQPTFTMDGREIPIVEKEGIKMGKIEFKASAGNYDKDGNAKKTFKAAAKLGDKDILGDIEYFVAKPVIRVTTGTAPTLYMGCGNSVNFEVPALGTSYKPTFSATGAEVVNGSKVGNVIIIPNARKVSVTVKNEGVALGNEPFDVKNVPRPRIIAKDNGGRDIDLKNGMSIASAVGLKVVAEADENFKAEVPKDANFRVRDMSVTLARGTTTVKELTFTSETVDLSSVRALMKPGDRLVIQPKKVIRQTFKNTTEPVNVTGNDIININLK